MSTKRASEVPPGAVPLSPKDRARMAKLYKEVLSRIESMAGISAKTVGKPAELAESTDIAEVVLLERNEKSAGGAVFQISAAGPRKAQAAAKSRPYSYGYSPDGY